MLDDFQIWAVVDAAAASTALLYASSGFSGLHARAAAASPAVTVAVAASIVFLSHSLSIFVFLRCSFFTVCVLLHTGVLYYYCYFSSSSC